jgi:formamidopyrimidine-DNA glycosylase
MPNVPELPEIEVLRRSLEPHLVGDNIAGITVRCALLRVRVDGGSLRRRLTGRPVISVRRRGKYLLVDVEGDSTLVVHLGMSGRLTLGARSRPREPHEHVILPLASGSELRYRDPRRFGLMMAMDSARLARHPLFRDLGVEPLSEEFSGPRLRALGAGRRGPLKSFLMDGRLVVGVGNIYASESLYRAGIHPNRSVARVSAERWDRLAAAVKTVLSGAIAEGGTTLNDFADGLGEAGEFQGSLEVYGRESEPCGRCGEPIRRFLQGGRSTYYCPGCQR